MASKLGSDPIGSRLNTKVGFAESSSIIVVPLRSWKYAVLVVTTRWQYHLCTCLQINPRKTRAILSDLFNFFFHLICHASLFCSVLSSFISAIIFLPPEKLFFYISISK
jgi:hypothetical protein